MKEVIEKREIETIMGKKAIDVGKGRNLRRGDTKAKSFINYLLSWENIFVREKNEQALILIKEIKKKFLEFYPKKISQIEIIGGWERGGDYPIWKDINNNFVVKIWYENKEQIYKVPKENLNSMLNVIRQLKVGIGYKCYAIAKKLGYDWKTIWKERTDLYFPKYYIPLKCLDKLGIISYGGNKKIITRLR